MPTSNLIVPTIFRAVTISSRTGWQPDVNGDVLLPKFTRTEDANTPVGLLDLNLDLFLKLCPTRKELPLLAHIRHVATDDKVPLEMVADGEFSVLVANRFPPLGANTVYLISLEGWNYLLDAPDKPQPASRVRLITLASWSFVNDPTGHDTFGGLMQQLNTNSAVFGITAPGGSGSSYVDQALQRGYVPLDYKPRESTPTFAWYRGPLAPLKRDRITGTTFERADAAMIVDPDRGIIDVSYACAWELGRLSALSSPAFVKGLRLFVEQKQNVSEFTAEIEKLCRVASIVIQGPDHRRQETSRTDRHCRGTDRVDRTSRVALSGAIPLPRSASVTAAIRIAALLSSRRQLG